MRSGAPTAAGALLALCALALPGCYSYSQLTVSVRDRSTHDPVPNVRVEVSNTSLLNPIKPEAASGETDAQGEVSLKVAAYNRLLIRATALGRAAHLVNADHPRIAGESDWFGPPTDESGARATLEFRLTP